MYFAADCLFGI